MITCVRRKAKHFFHVAALALMLMPAVGCVHRQKACGIELTQCKDENTKMRLELNRKNDRLERFNQLNKDGSLRGE